MSETVKHIDALVVQQLMNGNENAFRTLFDKYSNDIFAYGLSIVKSRQYAEELVQDVFLKIWSNRERLNMDLSFRAYIYTIARNLAFNFLKKAVNDKKLREEVFYLSQKFYNTTDSKVQEAEYAVIMEEALRLLPPKRKRIFKMSREEGKSYLDISSELGISVSTVKSQMSKALETFRTFLHANGDISFMLTFLCVNYLVVWISK